MLASLVAILAAVAIFAVATVVLVRRDLRGSLDTALRQRAQEVAQLAVSAPAVLNQPGALESPVSGRQIAVEVVDAQGRILARSLTLGAQLLPLGGAAHAALAFGRAGFQAVSLGGKPFRLYAAPIADAGGPAGGGAVLVASDTSDITRTVRHLYLLITLSGLGAALLAAFAAAAMTRRGLRPLRRLAEGAREIERTGDPARRLPAPSVEGGEARSTADEIAQLTGVLNRMLDSLEHSSDTERRFLADASHELRTPVTALLGNVEYAARHGADPDVLADLRRDAARLARLVDDLLTLERERGTSAEPELVALDRLARAAVSDAADGRVNAETMEPVYVRGDPEALRRALDNLIENALVHGPTAGNVRVAVRSGQDSIAEITVRDDGPGPDPADRERLFERFWRGRDASERPGSGLGLSIVAAIASRHDGAVDVSGSTFTLRLPAVAQGNSHTSLKET